MTAEGPFAVQLDVSCDHLPLTANIRVQCGLYFWHGLKTEKNIVHCPTCNVNLCV